MTPTRLTSRSLPVLAALAVLFIASWAFAQLQSPEVAAPGTVQPATERTGDAQAPAAAASPTSPATDVAKPENPAATPAVSKPVEKEPLPTASGQTQASAEEPSESVPGEPKAQEPAQPAAKVAAPDMTAFVAALAAAERANDNLAARIAQMEASSALQRERDQAFIRDMIKGVLLLSGGMATIGMLALVAIVYLQLRSTKQQAITFAAQLQALTSQIALPGPVGAPAVSLRNSKSHFDSTAQKIEQRLNDLESMATGLPHATAGIHDQDVPETSIDTHSPSGDDTAPAAGIARGEKASELLAKANSLLMQQQPEVALAYLDQAINRSPDNPEAHLKRGAALERLNRLDDALAAYDRAIAAAPTLSVAFLAKAGVLNKLQRYGEALKCYEVALAQQGGREESESSAA